VPCDLGLRRLDLETGIPGTTTRAVESAANRVRMREGRVDDVVMGNAKHRFIDANVRHSIIPGQQAVIGCMVQVDDDGKVAIVVGDADDHTFPALAVLRGNEHVGVESANACNGGDSQCPPRRASRSLRTVANAGNPPFMRYSCGADPPKIGFPFGSCIQRSADSSPWRMFNALKMPTR